MFMAEMLGHAAVMAITCWKQVDIDAALTFEPTFNKASTP